MKNLMLVAMLGIACGTVFADDACEPPKPDKTVTVESDTVQSCDPNEIAGPLGTGEGRYVLQGEWMNYTIYFENKTNATAAAQEITVTLPMDPGLDWSTLELGEIAFGEHIDMGLNGKRHGSTSYALPGTNTSVKTEVSTVGTNLVWYLRIYDPTTLDNFPEDPRGGFLPPNDPETHCGEGHLSYRVKVSDATPNGTVIRASADIQFDTNEHIETDPSWWNTVGVDTPMASFAEREIVTEEGAAIELAVSGGNAEKASSVGVYLTYQTAAAADIDLKTATVDGVTPKGGVKFPLTLSWAKGEVTNRVIRIPVKTDKAVEDDETLVFQLAAAQGQELGETCECKVTIRDMNVVTDYAEKQTKTTTKTKRGVDDNYGLNIACVAGDGSGEVCGYTSGQGTYYKGCKASLKATARPGWEFKGWGEVAGGVTNVVSEKASWNVTLTNEAEVVALFGRIPYVAGLADPADGGKVTGSGYCAEGKKVTLKAKANKNFTFVGWYAAAGGASGEPVSRLPSLVLDRSTKPAKSDAKQFVITNVSESVTYYARFASDPEVFVTVTATDGKGDALTGKGAGKYVAGTITGAGKYAKDKKVTLKATANRGYVFAGWYEGGVDGGNMVGSAPRDDRTTMLSQAASYVIAKMPTNDVELVAAFVTSDEDKASIRAEVNGMVLPSSGDGTPPPLTTNVMTGVYLKWPVTASALSETTVKVAGLPSGLKFTAKPITSKVTSGTVASKVTTVVTNVPANTIYGAPTAASKTAKDKTTGLMTVTPSKVKVTVTTAGKSKAEYVIDLTVDPLPAWAQGEFSGLASTAEGRLGSASMSVTAAGKVSGKVIVNGTNCTFSAASYDITSKTVGETNLVAVVTGKLGKEAVTGGITVVASGATGAFAGAEMSLFRNVWKDKGAEPVPEKVQGLYTVKLGADERGTGYLSLTVDKKGAVKVAGKATDGTALSGSATLILSGTAATPYFADLFCAPSAYKGGYVAGRLGWDADGRVSSAGLDWTSINPQSTADYYAGGFDRGLSASGARYVKTDAPNQLGTADVRLTTPEGAELKTFSFAQSTGVWKGTLFWDFGDPSLDPVKVPFEGILVQGEDLEGFGTYDVSASYVPYDKKGQPQATKSYKAKESMPVRFSRE